MITEYGVLMIEYLMLALGLSMVYYGIFHWPEKPKKHIPLIIDAEWEEIDPNRNKIDTYV
jgi:hypothetical protein